MNGDLGNISLISHNTKINGEVTSSSDLRIDGEIEGTINTTGKIVVGNSGLLKCKASCSNADISGEFIGDLEVKEKILIKSTGKFSGSVKCGKISIELGAVFNGTCEMNPDYKEEIRKDKKR